jgi:hypothetical protein
MNLDPVSSFSALSGFEEQRQAMRAGSSTGSKPTCTAD